MEQAAAPWADTTPSPSSDASPTWPAHWDLPPGVVPRQQLREAERLGIIATSAVEIPQSSFQPASLDLLLGPPPTASAPASSPANAPCASASTN